MSVDAAFWNGKRVLLTGHTGFKGSWFALWLTSVGAEVHGYALPPPTEPNLYTLCRAGDVLESVIGDVRDRTGLEAAMVRARPEVIFHMAAQPIVRRSYEQPLETFETNALGTLYLLEAARRLDGLRALVVVTSDKCYEPHPGSRALKEDDALGGHDPYSCSKACAELISACYGRALYGRSTTGARVATARAGNVVGGGDWGEDRLVPDCVRALTARTPILVRNPDSVRPWQHVLEPLAGYALLAQRLWEREDGTEGANGWNFGPLAGDTLSVREVVAHLCERWDHAPGYVVRREDDAAPETPRLLLDSSRARKNLGWSSRWGSGEALDRVAEWTRGYLAGEDPRALCLQQIAEYSRTVT